MRGRRCSSGNIVMNPRMWGEVDKLRTALRAVLEVANTNSVASLPQPHREYGNYDGYGNYAPSNSDADGPAREEEELATFATQFRFVVGMLNAALPLVEQLAKAAAAADAAGVKLREEYERAMAAPPAAGGESGGAHA